MPFAPHPGERHREPLLPSPTSVPEASSRNQTHAAYPSYQRGKDERGEWHRLRWGLIMSQGE